MAIPVGSKKVKSGNDSKLKSGHYDRVVLRWLKGARAWVTRPATWSTFLLSRHVAPRAAVGGIIRTHVWNICQGGIGHSATFTWLRLREHNSKKGGAAVPVTFSNE